MSSTSNWPPEDAVFEITDIDLAVADGPHPFHLAEKQASEANWEREVAANPHLFNGDMMLQYRLTIDDGVMRGEGHMVPYSTFLWWRKQQAPSSGVHVFAFAVPVSSDGAIVAIRMSERTANPGQVYCAAGSFDTSDIVDGHLDVTGNMEREVREETGLELSSAVAGERLFASRRRRRFVLFRFFQFQISAEEMLGRIANHADEEQEIDGAVAIRSADRQAHTYNPIMFPILDIDRKSVV